MKRVVCETSGSREILKELKTFRLRAFARNEAPMLKLRSKKQRTLPGRTLLLLTQPSVAILAVMLVLMQWRIPTVVRMTVTYTVENIDQLNGLTEELKAGNFFPASIKTLHIQYPDFPKARPVTIMHITETLVNSLGELAVKELGRDVRPQEIRFQLDGIVEVFRVRSKTKNGDLRLTYFDRFLRSQNAMLGLLMIWLVFTGVGWFKVYQELVKR